ncbi:MAG: transcriptional regulator [Elusimicrobia bacterium RIFCSPLOWO2_02_FULL_39_32]|nr:MAG: transcriptional regulator [Elusimicrobia bacterium GWA2_38_7]OGR80563.1 MAG: transcriptional regulator [Elusimicrobia bacterium RIFCSPHIGHO2_02_FULL_39_36]OGR91245.1 MAG: transcriptional regulator [Elusimicrobia bacterium RIFCSPLOWO2_02_FULL_39_32]OGS00620.1 MAG: transcriptional regulator [Elusimicrobia bacterium RIFCSPLOWO2_12_FULL_39_28]
MTTVTISMPEPMKEFVKKQIKNKGFGNVSEYVRTLLRKAQEQEADAKLETLLMKGLESGEDIKITREFWKDLKAEASQLLKKHRKTASK